jgi:lysophospholipase L1-like esterase
VSRSPNHGRPHSVVVACVLLLGSVHGCASGEAGVSGPDGQDSFARYVAIGTSLSMGYSSGGVIGDMQQRAWPALVANGARVRLKLPEMKSPGCTPPLVAPLQLGRVLSGQPVNADSSCAGLATGLTVPGTSLTSFDNLAIAGVTLRDALRVTGASATTSADGNIRRLAPLILGVRQTQVRAMLARNPTFVSIELGANDVLPAVISGLVAPNVTVTPLDSFTTLYTAMIDSVKQSGTRALLVTVPTPANAPGVYRGSALWAERAGLLRVGVAVDASCGGADSSALVFAALVVPSLAQRAAASGAPQALRCTNVPGTQDNVLSPDEASTVTTLVGGYNALITSLASANGYALLDANAVLSTMLGRRPAYRAAAQLGCALPYGQYASLDGIHPNGYGHALIAEAAVAAINRAYGFALLSPSVPLLSAAEQCGP